MEPYKGLREVLEHIIPTEVRARLQEKATKCVASYVKNPHKRCSRNSTKKGKDAKTILDEISKCVEQESYTALPEHLEKLADRVTCGQHRNSALKATKEGSRIDILRFFISSLRYVSVPELPIFTNWTTALAGGDLSTAAVCGREPIAAVSTMTKTTFESSSISASISMGFLPYNPTPQSKFEIARNLRKTITQPLSTRDLEEGSIYVFWDEGTFGMVKIGRTNDLGRRLKEWKRCKATHSYHKSSLDGELVKVSHVARVERLMHIELINSRKKIHCSTCPKTETHDEWFEMNEAKAVKVFRKWHAWMLKEPYVKNDKGVWTFRPEMLDTLPELCWAELEEEQSPLTTRQQNRKPKAKRPSLPKPVAWRILNPASARAAHQGEHIVAGEQEVKHLKIEPVDAVDSLLTKEV
jgi:hypothetical protein